MPKFHSLVEPTCRKARAFLSAHILLLTYLVALSSFAAMVLQARAH